MIATIATVTSRTLARNVSTSQPLQKRTFINWMTNYPDRVRALNCLVCLWRLVCCFVLWDDRLF